MRDAPATKQPWWRVLWHRGSKAVRKVVHLEDTPYRIAAGAGAGIFSSVLPVIGQTFVGMILARLLRGNVIASIPWSWLSNPFTTLPIWYGCYRVGVFVLPSDEAPLSFSRIGELVTAFSELSFWRALSEGFDVVKDIFVPTLVGSLLIGTAIGVLGYLLIHRLVVWWQLRRSQRLGIWRDRVAAQGAAQVPADTAVPAPDHVAASTAPPPSVRSPSDPA